MAIIKCKMCGGDIELSADKTFGTCEFCGSTMTLPKVDDDQRAAAFNRGNHFRRIGEFDKALAVYERIVSEDNTDAEAHWCCALCRFGIEYVEDPATYEWLPTCHRASFDSFLEDVDYLAALEYSDGVTKRQYQKDAAKIAEVQRGILVTSQNAEPYDVFICYKESDENGERTRDSALAQDVYYQLTEQGRKVFFARITLEDVVGAQYEPYIFAALNSAKVMVVIGTKAEHLNAVWVKNEWSRFLSLMKKDHSKLLLPCYRDMDPYDMPEQLGVLQSYDMSKIGFLQDLIRGIAKVLDANKQPAVKETVVVQSGSNSNNNALLKRGFMALEDGEWAKADDFFEQVLNHDAECAQAYWGKALAEARCPNEKAYVSLVLSNAKNVRKTTLAACQKATEREQAAIQAYAIPNFLTDAEISQCFNHNGLEYTSKTEGLHEAIAIIERSMEQDRTLTRAFTFASGEFAKQLAGVKEDIINEMESRIESSKQSDEERAKELVDNYANRLTQAESRAKALYNERFAQRDKVYRDTCTYLQSATTAVHYRSAANTFEGLCGYEDSAERKEQCLKRAAQLDAEAAARAKAEAEAEARAKAEEEARAQAEAEAQARAEAEEEARQEAIRREKAAQRAARNKKLAPVYAAVAILAGAYFVVTKIVIPNNQYNDAMALMDQGKYMEAIVVFEQIAGYKDSTNKLKECRSEIKDILYLAAVALMDEGKYEEAIVAFQEISEYKDCSLKIAQCQNTIKYDKAMAFMTAKEYEEAMHYLNLIDIANYQKAADLKQQCYLEGAKYFYDNKDYNTAISWYECVNSYDKDAEFYLSALYNEGDLRMQAGKFTEAVSLFEKAGNYKDVKAKISSAMYEFVIANKNSTNPTTCSYLKELKEVNYKDSAKIYNELYVWKVTLEVINTNEYDTSTKVGSLTKKSSYLHMGFKVSGGEPGAKATFFYQITLPSGKINKPDWYWENKANGDYMGVKFSNGFTSNATGTMTIEVYNKDTGELVGSHKIQITD